MPIISATIVGDRAYMLRNHHRLPPGIGVEVMATLCLSGPAAEDYFISKFEDGSDKGDYEMARKVLARKYDALQIGAALSRY